MNKVAVIVLIAITYVTNAIADVKVKGYYRSDGTYVAPHYRSSPNKTVNDNWSTYGNVNPYTGEKGTLRVQDSGLKTYGHSPDFLGGRDRVSHVNAPAVARSSISANFPKNTSYTQTQKKQQSKARTGEMRDISWLAALFVAFMVIAIIYFPLAFISSGICNVLKLPLSTQTRWESKILLFSVAIGLLLAGGLTILSLIF